MKTKELRKVVGVFMSTLLLMSMCTFMSCGDDDDEITVDAIQDFHWEVVITDSGRMGTSEIRNLQRALEDIYASHEKKVQGVKSEDAIYEHRKVVEDMESRFLDDLTIPKSYGTIIFTVTLYSESNKAVKSNTFTVEYENCTVK